MQDDRKETQSSEPEIIAPPEFIRLVAEAVLRVARERHPELFSPSGSGSGTTEAPDQSGIGNPAQ